MTQFLRLLAEGDKAQALLETCTRLRAGEADPRHFEVAPSAFDAVPGKPFAYWVSEAVRETFRRLPSFEDDARTAVNGLTTGDDFRFFRCHWEVSSITRPDFIDSSVPGIKEIPPDTHWRWFSYVKGGEDSPFYGKFPMVLNWRFHGKEMKAFSGTIVRSEEHFYKPGLTWPLRARRFGPQCRPLFSVFSVRGYSAIAPDYELLRLLGLTNTSVFDYLFKISLGRHGFPEFIVGVLNKLPIPDLSDDNGIDLVQQSGNPETV
ncbi:hypothetical protein [Thiocystis violacea]|uniref:hypothetical protein n=1 Tax=Thiocystis violacea TaxID=13725 RepID=UPI001907611B|nr:hypothetical protein [Thiocystis violacea]